MHINTMGFSIVPILVSRFYLGGKYPLSVEHNNIRPGTCEIALNVPPILVFGQTMLSSPWRRTICEVEFKRMITAEINRILNCFVQIKEMHVFVDFDHAYALLA